MKYAVVWVGDFALHALRRTDEALAGRPVALTAGEGRKAVLTQVSPEAKGVAPGMAVTLAMAHCPGILLRQRDPIAEVEAQRLLLAAAFTLSPRVEATAAGWCTVDLQGADPARTGAQMRLRLHELAQTGLPARIGAAGTPLLASFAARQAEPLLIVENSTQFLRPLPLAFAEPTAAQVVVLTGWGIRTLGDLTALSKADIAQRLGTDGVALWERAAGETIRVLRQVDPVKTFVAEWEYEPPVESIEPLFFRLRAYAERLALELRAAAYAAEELTLTLFLEDETDYRRNFRLPEPSVDLEAWLRILHLHLENVRTAARVNAVRLVVKETRPPERQGGLFDTGLRDPAAFWESLARVGALIGDERVGTPVLLDTHRPDSFALTKPTELVPAPAEAPVHTARGLTLRRFRPAWSAKVEIKNERPVAMESTHVSGAIVDAAGPWRFSGDWWKPRSWANETWQVELGTGGLYQLTRTAHGWFVEGVLD